METNREKLEQRPRTVAERALAGLSQLKDALERDEPLPKQLTVRSIELNLEPHEYDGEDIRDLRNRLQVSQVVFAELMCASVHTLRSWEQNKRPAPKLARRLFDEIQSNPSRWVDWIHQMVESRREIGREGLEAQASFPAS